MPWGGFVILGQPVSHSLSPVFQNAALEAVGARQRYERLEVAPAELTRVLDLLGSHRIAGNVTIPHKEAVAAYARRLTDTALATGAVNTFWWDDDGLVGHNTDVHGVQATLAALLPHGVRGPVVVLGAGGSAAAVLHAVRLAGVTDVHLAARTTIRAHDLLTRLGMAGTVHAFGERDSLRAPLQQAALVVNCTPVGLHGASSPAVPSADLAAMPVALERLGPDTAVFDVVYRAAGTEWIHAAQHQGRPAEDGLRMLVEQGAAAFESWTGVPAPREMMWRALGQPVPDAHRPRVLAASRV